MYYLGIPFEKNNQLESTNTQERYFQELETNENIQFCNAVFEGVLQNEVDLVVYQEAEWNDDRLIEHHNLKYGSGVPFYTVNKLSSTTYKHTVVLNEQVTQYQVFKYDTLGRVVIEQIFDKGFLLLEYREFFYQNGTIRTPYKEKVFLSSWHISEEEYT